MRIKETYELEFRVCRPGGRHMTSSTLMVRLTPGGSNSAILSFAADVAARFKSTKIIGIAACQPLQVYASSDSYVPSDAIQQNLQYIEKEMKAAEARFRSALQGKATTLEWRSTIDYVSLPGYITNQMRAADLLLTAVPERSSVFDTSHKVDMAELVLRAGKPVVIAGGGVDRLDLQSVLVGWKDTREARRAVADALPFLKLADRVTVVEIAVDEALTEARARTDDVAGWLAGHGVAATARADASLGDDATQLSSIAHDLNANLLVAGAYGHTRLREWVLGGVTRDLLLRPPRCSFVAH
jgi:nucleotide-binding universal stress UspA family protein